MTKIPVRPVSADTRGRFKYRFALAAALLLPGAASAQVYKCTDADGRVKYSQTRPRDADCQETGLKPAPQVGTDVEGVMRMGKQVDERRKVEAREAEKTGREQAARDQQCGHARARLSMLESTGRWVQVDDQGERHYQSDADKDAELLRVRQFLAGNCS